MSIPHPDGVEQSTASPSQVPDAPTPGAPPPPPPPPARGRPRPVKARAVPTTPGPEGEGGKSRKPLLIGIAAAAVLAIAGLVALLIPSEEGEQLTGALPLPDGEGQAVRNEAEEATEPMAAQGREPARPTLNLGDLSFVQNEAESLWVIQLAKMLDSPVGKSTLANIGEGPLNSIGGLSEKLGVDPGDIDFIAIAFSKLTLSARFAYIEQKAYLERRISVTRSSTQRKRLERSLSQLAPPQPSAMLAKVRFKGVADLEKILSEIEEKETIEARGERYVRFSLPPDLHAAYPVDMAAYQIDATDLLLGHEPLVREAMENPSAVSLAELGVSEADLTHDILMSVAPSADAKRQIKAIVGHELHPDRNSSGISPSIVNSFDQLSSGLIGIKIGAGVEITTAITCLTEVQAREAASGINGALPKLLEKFDVLFPDLPARLKGPLRRGAQNLNATQDGLRVEAPLSLASEMFREGASEILGEMNLASLFMQETPAAEQAPAPPPSPGTPVAPPVVSTAGAGNTTSARQTTQPGGVTPGRRPPTPPNRTLRGWTMNILHAAIADKPVIGRVSGGAFMADEALLENGVLILRMGSEDSPKRVVEIHNLQRAGELIDGKTFELAHVSGVNTPAVFLRWQDPTRLGMNTKRFYNGFAIKLEFDRIRGGRITGRVFVAVPDGKKSYVNGTFDAEAR